MQSVNFQGIKEREWTLDSPVRYIKIVGGPANKEGLLLGLKNGQVCTYSNEITFEFIINYWRNL